MAHHPGPLGVLGQSLHCRRDSHWQNDHIGSHEKTGVKSAVGWRSVHAHSGIRCLHYFLLCSLPTFSGFQLWVCLSPLVNSNKYTQTIGTWQVHSTGRIWWTGVQRVRRHVLLRPQRNVPYYAVPNAMAVYCASSLLQIWLPSHTSSGVLCISEHNLSFSLLVDLFILHELHFPTPDCQMEQHWGSVIWIWGKHHSSHCRYQLIHFPNRNGCHPYPSSSYTSTWLSNTGYTPL